MTISSKEELDAIVKEVENADYSVADIKKGERTKKAPVPFTTSTLQQEASKAAEFLRRLRQCVLRSSYMKVLTSRAVER